MSDWSAGYVADIDYTYGYYPELSPLRARLPLLNQGLHCPRIDTACELGFGQGFAICTHGAATNIKWYGNDFNPAQAGFAQEMASAIDGNINVFDDSFEEFAQRSDLPEFDFIAMHGVWSWISDENRKIIVDFIDDKLKVGGILYVSYNTLPGWSAFAQMRHLMTQHTKIMGSKGEGIVSRIDNAIAFSEQLEKVEPLYGKIFPHVKERIAEMKEKDKQYLAHEYFNKDWHPMHFSNMVDLLGPAKLQYACSAHYPDHIDALNLTQEQQQLLKTIPNVTFRESVRDFMTNQSFRRDYWVKGLRRLSPPEQLHELSKLRFILSYPRKDIKLKVKGMLGEAELSKEIYIPILDCFADHKIKSIEQVEDSVSSSKINSPQLIQAIMILASMGYIRAVQEEKEVASCRKKTARFNRYLLDKSMVRADLNFLASPVIGSCIAVNRCNQLFIQALDNNMKTAEQLAQYVWKILSSQGVAIMKENKALESEAESMSELQSVARDFLENFYPILKSLQAV
ncbi:MAG: class I SAM-dependent methyltransferase [Gammaproteobacteria bacterium]